MREFKYNKNLPKVIPMGADRWENRTGGMHNGMETISV